MFVIILASPPKKDVLFPEEIKKYIAAPKWGPLLLREEMFLSSWINQPAKKEDIKEKKSHLLESFTHWIGLGTKRTLRDIASEVGVQEGISKLIELLLFFKHQAMEEKMSWLERSMMESMDRNGKWVTPEKEVREAIHKLNLIRNSILIKILVLKEEIGCDLESTLEILKGKI
jgi:hypothetical protein